MRSIRFTALALPLALALAACGKKAPPDTLLGYVPADTPYVFANLEPTPKAINDAWMKSFEPMLGHYETMLNSTAKALEAEDAEGDPAVRERAARVIRALAAEFSGKLTLEGIQTLGFSTEPRFAMYGVGLVPVVRLELKDAEAFKALVARVEQRVGESMPVATVDGQSFWRVPLPDAPLAAALAVHDGDLVMTLVPASGSDDLIRGLLGLTLPERTLADDNRIAALNERLALTPHGSGYIDTVRLMESVLAERTPIEKEFLQALRASQSDDGDAPALDTPVSETCRGELLAIARKFPMLSFGNAKIDARAVDTVFVLETESTMAQQIAGLAAPVPGLGTPDGALMHVGFSLDIDKLMRFVDAQAAAVAAAPFACEELKELNSSFADLKTQMANPMMFAAAPVLRGFNARLTRFAMPADDAGTPDIAGKLVIASDNPQSLIALAGNFAPQLPAMGLTPGSGVQPLPAEMAPPGAPPIHVALEEKAIALSFGAGEEAGLADYAKAAPTNPPPLFALGYSGSFFDVIMAQASEGMEDLPEAEREEMAQSLELVRQFYGQTLDRIDMTMIATSRGIEFHQSMRLR